MEDPKSEWNRELRKLRQTTYKKVGGWKETNNDINHICLRINSRFEHDMMTMVVVVLLLLLGTECRSTR